MPINTHLHLEFIGDGVAQICVQPVNQALVGCGAALPFERQVGTKHTRLNGLHLATNVRLTLQQVALR
jgi:hypothetical protein